MFWFQERRVMEGWKVENRRELYNGRSHFTHSGWRPLILAAPAGTRHTQVYIHTATRQHISTQASPQTDRQTQACEGKDSSLCVWPQGCVYTGHTQKWHSSRNGYIRDYITVYIWGSPGIQYWLTDPHPTSSVSCILTNSYKRCVSALCCLIITDSLQPSLPNTLVVKLVKTYGIKPEMCISICVQNRNTL